MLSGNVYISDHDNYRVREVAAVTGNVPGLPALALGHIYTVAGTGLTGYAGESGPAASAQLAYPNGLALDGATPTPDLFIADMQCHAIRRVDATGAISTPVSNCSLPGGNSINGTQAPDAEAQFIYSVAVNQTTGSIYIADYRSNVVRQTVPYPQPVSFGTGTGPTSKTIFLTVTAASPVTITSITTSSTPSGQFVVGKVTGWGGSTCVVGGSVSPGTVCKVPMTFTQCNTCSASQSGTLTVVTSGGGMVTISLIGGS